jgi:hypothetical protein
MRRESAESRERAGKTRGRVAAHRKINEAALTFEKSAKSSRAA